ncbi:MAG TPA: NAD(P)-dependent oxidoreductase [Limnobacter sp.]|nr:NAD(P)-dependent oxidoreductase [Limnobacter sp.]
MNTLNTSTPIGFVGLGNMGGPMVRHLSKAGFAVHAWARNPAAIESLKDTTLKPADSLQALCQSSQVICLNVTRTEDVESLLFRADGIAEHAKAGTVIVDFSTIDAGRVKAFAPTLKALQIDYLDSPVSGGAAAAQAATLTIMVGGDRAVFERILPLLHTLGKTVRHVGPNGAGQAIKAANQMAMCIQLVGIAEAMNYALEQGADLGITLEVLQSGLAGSKVLDWAGPHMVEGFARPPSIQAHLHAKDVNMVADAARAQGLNLPLLYRTADILRELVENGPVSQDTARVFELVRAHLRG